MRKTRTVVVASAAAALLTLGVSAQAARPTAPATVVPPTVHDIATVIVDSDRVDPWVCSYQARTITCERPRYGGYLVVMNYPTYLADNPANSIQGERVDERAATAMAKRLGVPLSSVWKTDLSFTYPAQP